MYNDPDRADVAEWLDAHGWRADAVTSQDEMRRLGRCVELVPSRPTDDSPISPTLRHRSRSRLNAGARLLTGLSPNRLVRIGRT